VTINVTDINTLALKGVKVYEYFERDYDSGDKSTTSGDYELLDTLTPSISGALLHLVNLEINGYVESSGDYIDVKVVVYFEDGNTYSIELHSTETSETTLYSKNFTQIAGLLMRITKIELYAKHNATSYSTAVHARLKATIIEYKKEG